MKQEYREAQERANATKEIFTTLFWFIQEIEEKAKPGCGGLDNLKATQNQEEKERNADHELVLNQFDRENFQRAANRLLAATEDANGGKSAWNGSKSNYAEIEIDNEEVLGPGRLTATITNSTGNETPDEARIRIKVLEKAANWCEAWNKARIRIEYI